MMRFDTRVGEKIRFTKINVGFDCQRDQALRLLKYNGVYTVSSLKVSNYSSRVELVEHPGIWFNCLFFINV